MQSLTLWQYNLTIQRKMELFQQIKGSRNEPTLFEDGFFLGKHNNCKLSYNQQQHSENHHLSGTFQICQKIK